MITLRTFGVWAKPLVLVNTRGFYDPLRDLFERYYAERFAKPEQRVENAGWVLPTDDERLTLITCWPYESNTHRLVLVAKPVAELSLAPTGGE